MGECHLNRTKKRWRSSSCRSGGGCKFEELAKVAAKIVNAKWLTGSNGSTAIANLYLKVVCP